LSQRIAYSGRPYTGPGKGSGRPLLPDDTDSDMPT
jgi:hypothetical protein